MPFPPLPVRCTPVSLPPEGASRLVRVQIQEDEVCRRKGYTESMSSESVSPAIYQLDIDNKLTTLTLGQVCPGIR